MCLFDLKSGDAGKNKLNSFFVFSVMHQNQRRRGSEPAFFYAVPNAEVAHECAAALRLSFEQRCNAAVARQRTNWNLCFECGHLSLPNVKGEPRRSPALALTSGWALSFPGTI